MAHVFTYKHVTAERTDFSDILHIGTEELIEVHSFSAQFPWQIARMIMLWSLYGSTHMLTHVELSACRAHIVGKPKWFTVAVCPTKYKHTKCLPYFLWLPLPRNELVEQKHIWRVFCKKLIILFGHRCDNVITRKLFGTHINLHLWLQQHS